jgi:hypothetical protein
MNNSVKRILLSTIAATVFVATAFAQTNYFNMSCSDPITGQNDSAQVYCSDPWPNLVRADSTCTCSGAPNTQYRNCWIQNWQCAAGPND